MNDGTAFVNICQAGEWNGIAFIGNEKNQPASITRDPGFELPLYTANRWSCLESFDEICHQHAITISENTAVVFDLDKTSLGARGRNDAAIDLARTRAAEDVVRAILGSDFNSETFLQTYQTFNQVAFHSFTTDNQDYLVYLCLLACADVIDTEQLSQQIQAGTMRSFEAFANILQARQPTFPAAIQETQSDFYQSLLSGDPTPFKAFRRQEYLNTVTAMRTPPTFDEEQLNSTICITEEVRQFALVANKKAHCCLGFPINRMKLLCRKKNWRCRDFQPLHRTLMLSVSQP